MQASFVRRILLSLFVASIALAPVAIASPGPALHPAAKVASGHSLTRVNTPVYLPDGTPAGLTQKLTVAAAKKAPALNSQKRITRSQSKKEHFEVKEVKAAELPMDPPFELLICPNQAEVKVLANEITYGAGGPQVPTRLSYELNGVTTLMFEGANVAPGVEQTIALQQGEELRFWGHSAYPDFDDPSPWVNYLVPSDDAVNAAVIVNGDNFLSMALAKGMQSPFGMQQSLETILNNNALAGAINWQTGLVTLEPNEMIVLFELGASSPASSAFDFNDLVIFVRTPCPVQQPYDLRNNIPGVRPANLRVSTMEDTVTAVDANAAINFIGDGRIVNFVEVYFVALSATGTPNVWTPSLMNFKLSGRRSGTASYVQSPLNSTEPNDWTQVYDTPSNADWLTPIYTNSGFNVYRAAFSIPSTSTVIGQEHTITWNGLGPVSGAGKLMLLFSNNGPDGSGNPSFGASSDWRWSTGTGTPASLSSVGAPFPTVAARVGFIPPP